MTGSKQRSFKRGAHCLLTRPPVVAGAAPPRGERPHCVALVGATARRLRAAAGGVVVEPLPLLADLPDLDDDSSDDDSESDDDDDDPPPDGEEGPTASPRPAAALADILPGHETLFPVPAAAHDAGCAAVAALLAEGAPLAWSPAAHARLWDPTCRPAGPTRVDPGQPGPPASVSSRVDPARPDPQTGAGWPLGPEIYGVEF